MNTDLRIDDVALIIFLTGHLAAAIWWGSKLGTRVDGMRDQLQELVKDVKSLALQAARISVFEEDVRQLHDHFDAHMKQVHNRVDKVEERVDRVNDRCLALSKNYPMRGE